MIKPKVMPSFLVLENLSAGQPLHNIWVTGQLNLDSLVVSRWLCGEDMRGIYQPVVMHNCFLDELDLAGRTFYEMVELVECRITVARCQQTYFYSSLLIEDCTFKGDFYGQGMQSDGLVIIHNTVFAGYADFSGIHLRHIVNFLDVSFPGGTNLLHELAHTSPTQVTLKGCHFCPGDVPPGFDLTRFGAQLPLNCESENQVRAAKDGQIPA